MFSLRCARRLWLVVGILVPTVLAITLCVVMLCRWRQNKDPLPAPARNALTRTSTALRRTFRRHDRQTSALSVQYQSSTDGGGRPANNELKSLVRSVQRLVNIGMDLEGHYLIFTFLNFYRRLFNGAFYAVVWHPWMLLVPMKDSVATISKKVFGRRNFGKSKLLNKKWKVS